jgi:O-antigen ligase
VKWAVLAITLAAVGPLAEWLRRNPRETPKIWMLMGFLPFGISYFHLYMAAVSWAEWPGYVKGAEISIMDLLALALYLSQPSPRPALPFRLSMALYFLAVLLSAFQTSVPLAALFDAWQLARMFLVYAVVAKACADERVVPAILTGMTIGLSMEACVTMWQRFGMGVLQTPGTMDHQNFLGLMSHFVTFPWVALLLAGERGWRPVVGPLAGLVVAAMTVSRGTVGLVGGGYVGLFGLSAMRRWTPRKALLLAAGIAVACLLTPIVLSSFDKRFSVQQADDYDERAAFEKAAGMIVMDHPMGIGANNYVVIANTGGYNSRAGVAWVIGSDSANVHNIYYLVTAETGYVGLVTFVIMLLQPLMVAFRCSWRNRGDRRGDLLLGLGMSLLVVYIHSYFEWIFITFSAQYMFALDVGLVAGLATQLGYWQRTQVGNRFEAHGTIGPSGKMAQN